MQGISNTVARRVVAGAGLAALVSLAAATPAWYGMPQPPGVSHTAAAPAGPDTVTPGISPASAQSLEDKMRALSSPILASNIGSLKPIAITEAEANSYLKYRGGTFLPPAVHDPELHITTEHVSGAADVDFGALNQTSDGAGGGGKPAQPNDWTTRALSGLFTGKQRVAATGKLETANGEGRVTIEQVSIGTITVPPVLVDWLVQNYVAKRYKIDLSKPFALPDHVTHIELGEGRALFVRSPNK
ncbi:MAG TPA: hypothetical protein VKU44_09375 [Terriglobia bacterium]|nr:hypothetical protein [Terriglobia bacterium]